MKLLISRIMAFMACTLLFSSSVFALTGGSSTGGSSSVPCHDCSNGFQRGSVPSVSQLEAVGGPYRVRTIGVSDYSASGFGGGTIHYSTETGGQQGVVAAIPGYVSYESSIKWWGELLGSWGFVVITIDTNSIYDQPDSRADQLSAALDHVIAESKKSSSAIYGLVDESRVGVIGWSMGGGGTLKLSTERSLDAIIPQAPYYSGFNDFDEITTPTFIIACENDAIAPVNSHADDFYNDIPNSTPKAFMEINSGDHYCANSGNSDSGILGRNGVAWMKRFIDNDTRFSQFLCGPNFESDYAISDYRDTCNY